MAVTVVIWLYPVYSVGIHFNPICLEENRMAKKKGAAAGINKSDAIREYLEQDPGAGPKTIVTALKKRGIEVSHSLAGAVKYKGGAGKGAAKAGAPTKAAARQVSAAPRRTALAGSAAVQLSAADLLEAKRLVDHLGGIGQAHKALETLEQLRTSGGR
jgi:hypothetical protein